MAFVVTSGQLQSVTETSPYRVVDVPRSIALSPSLTQTYEQIWRAQPAVRTVTGFLARNVAQLGCDPYRRVSATDREKATDHALARLLERPLAGSKWTKYRLFNTLVHDLCIYDSAYWLKMRGEDGPVGVQRIPPSMMEPVGSNILSPDGYKLHGTRGRWREYTPEQVVHFHGYNPSDSRTGVAPIETLRQILAEEYAATMYRSQLWRNGARTGGYIQRPKDAPRWSPGARERFRDEWNAQYTGDSLEAGGTPILEDGMTWSQSAVTPKDAQYVESRKLTREETAVAYYVPPAMLGLLDGASFASVSEYHKMLYQDTLGPWVVQIAQDIEVQLLEDLDPSAAKAGLMYVEFNLKEKLRGSFEEQAKALQSGVGGPWLTRNEVRAMHNLPHIDGADELIVPLNVVEGGLASPNDTAPDNPNNEESNKGGAIADVLLKFFDRQGRVVKSRAGAGHRDAADMFDDSQWAHQLTVDLAHVGVDLPAVQLLNTCKAINAGTRADIAGALVADDPVSAVASLFHGYADDRVHDIARDLEAS